MRFLVVLGVFALCLSVYGQEKRPPGPPAPPKKGMRLAPPVRSRARVRLPRLPEELVKKFDKDGDGKLSKEERVAALKATFKKFMEKFDANKDGKLSDEELEKVKEDVKKMVEEYRQKVFKEALKEFDKDGDGKLSDEEKEAMRKVLRERYEKAEPERRKRLEEMRKKRLEEFDKDGDGKLSEEEKRAMVKALMKRHEEIRKKAEELAKEVFDTDGDGKLSEGERRAMGAFGMWMRAKFGRRGGLRHRKRGIMPVPGRPAPEKPAPPPGAAPAPEEPK